MAEFFEDNADGDCLFAVVKEGANFGFCSRGHDVFEDFGKSKDGTIESGVGSREESQEKMTT